MKRHLHNFQTGSHVFNQNFHVHEFGGALPKALVASKVVLPDQFRQLAPRWNDCPVCCDRRGRCGE